MENGTVAVNLQQFRSALRCYLPLEGVGLQIMLVLANP